ncbi:MAG: LamG domain-containing protein [Ignavibacteriota bacterium]|jgi:hypothetical protein|nr:LamG domain-containing protein [Ignavibacteriales bacterium]MBL1122510.1 LamG domain-containing protein [Ignavibacteriota bacterium]MCE7856545.1 LamG domain-containing protein [Ignavibacteria bacterium CHB3]MCZ7615555.1 LamG domain-containing protein [Ignavibacteriaceae bacterium]MEB2356052.1 LamG domain-containing protein [Ignavibacteriales bacterium]
MKIILTMLFLLLITQLITLAQPTQGLIAYYPFNGNANDLSGNGNNGATIGGCDWVQGVTGQACSFDGNGYISVPNSPSLQSPSTSLSIAFWLYLDEWTNGWAPILAKSNTSSSYGQYSLEINNNGTLNFWTGNGGNYFTHNLISDNWYHLAFTWDGNQAKFYIDGSLRETLNFSGFITSDELPLEIGRHIPGSTNDYLIGKLDELVLYNRALTNQEIYQLYSSTISQGLVAHYKFDGNYLDESGYNNTGNGFNTNFLTDRFGQEGATVFFNGIDSYVSVPNSASLSSPTNSISISLWFYLEQAYDLHNCFLTKSDQLNQSGQYTLNYCNCTDGNLIDLNIGNTANFIYHNFNLHEWYHLVVTYEGQLIKFYENGTFIGQTTFSGNIQVNDLPLEFGRNMPGLPDYYHGRIDDARIYNRALTETEIQELYHENGWTGRELNTIIITHGFTGDGLIFPINPITETKWKHLRWQFAMADAVSDNRDIYLIRKGNVYPIEATFSQFAAIDSNVMLQTEMEFPKFVLM